MTVPAGILLLVLGYALWYTGIGQLSGGKLTGGNTQGLSVSLGLDKLKGAAGAGAQSASATGPALTGNAPPVSGTVTPINPGSTGNPLPTTGAVSA